MNLDPDAAPLAEFLGRVGRRPQRARRAAPVGCTWSPHPSSTSTSTGSSRSTPTSRPTTSTPSTGTARPRRSTRRRPASSCSRNGHSRMLIRLHDGRSTGRPTAVPAAVRGRRRPPRRRHVLVPRVPEPQHRVLGAGFLFFITNWPTGPARRRTTSTSARRSPTDGDAHGDVNGDFMELNRAVLLEDLSVLPGMQRSIDAGALDAVHAQLPGAPHLPPARDDRPLDRDRTRAARVAGHAGARRARRRT